MALVNVLSEAAFLLNFVELNYQKPSVNPKIDRYA